MKLVIEDVMFDERGLVPAVVQDAATGEVLTVAYMSAESLRRTLESGETWFWSRSRAGLWHKGATSGHTQRVVRVTADCDADALTVAVEPRGPACHTGARSCFAREVAGSDEGLWVGRPAQNREGLATEATEDSEGEKDSGAEVSASHSAIRNSSASSVTSVAGSATDAVERQLADDSQAAAEVDRPGNELGATLAALYELIERRRRELPEGSYTTYLFTEGLDKILKKVGEESAETIIAAKNGDAARLVAEVSDLVYHLLVLLAERGVTLDEVGAELARRAGKGGGE